MYRRNDVIKALKLKRLQWWRACDYTDWVVHP